MKFLCKRTELSKALNTVSKAVTNRTTIPILKGILLEINDDHILNISASDLDLSIQKKIEVESYEKGAVVVSARLFVDIIKKLSSEDITIEVVENNVIIKSFNSEFSIVGQSKEDFPQMDSMDYEDTLKIEKEIFKNMIKQTSFSASQDESRGVIVGTLIEINQNYINMVSLDGFRMSVRKEYIDLNIHKNIIIHTRILNEIYKILTDEEADYIDIYIHPKNMIIKMNDTIIHSRLMEGNFIDYKNILPKAFNCSVKVNKEDMLDSLERASLLAREGKNNLIKMNIGEDKIIITSRSEEGKVQEEVYIEKEGENMDIGFNSKYILDILKNIDDEEIYMKLITSVSPVIISPLEGDSFEYLLLPVRISN
ncbi:MAG: DNA polymerase III subunit beta [Peptostreptococcales bacterium]